MIAECQRAEPVPKTLRVICQVTVEIPLSPIESRSDLQEDVLDAVKAAVVPRLPWVTQVHLAHASEFETR